MLEDRKTKTTWPLAYVVIVGGVAREQIACCPTEAEADRRASAGEVALGPAELLALGRVHNRLGGKVEEIRKAKR